MLIRFISQSIAAAATLKGRSLRQCTCSSMLDPFLKLSDTRILKLVIGSNAAEKTQSLSLNRPLSLAVIFPSTPGNFQHVGKAIKSSVPVLSAGPLYFQLSTLLTTLLAALGFSYIWPIALEFCSAHATRCMAPAALFFASRTENRVVFRVARVAKTLGF